MSRLRSVLRRLIAAVSGLSDQELVAIVGLALLGIGLWVVWIPLGLIVPGGLLVAIALGFNLQRSR